ncbi:MAG: exodeoxyribonuclease V subunit gamma [Beggiatoa sp. IS2]|nr:MAG: exodeoxyribonuclease V subunit gamma [Beggiatoa sp. IS2]
MFHVYTSNRLEILVETLAKTMIREPLPNPLTKEIIVVQSKGMERWVSLQLAEHLGIWANGYFPFPNAMLWQLFKNVLGHLPDTSPFEREVITWSLLGLLPNFLEHPAFAELQRYLHTDLTGIKRLQLAQRIANLFDQYIVFRPQMLAEWERGHSPESWQAILWRALVARYGTDHRAELRARFFQNVASPTIQQRLPKRLSVFGIPALPPFYLEVLAALGTLTTTTVQVFLVNPCQEHWGTIVTNREMRRLERQSQSPTDLHFEQGNSLLASLGKLGRDFGEMLLGHNPEISPLFVEPGEATVLNCVQTDLLHLQERGADIPKTTIYQTDKSIQIHVCHSPMREVEVLHDQLLALFAAHANLLPKDILVMTPAIENYAPFIQAVFTTQKRIPFSIADRSLRDESAIIDTFLAILELPKSRFAVNAVLRILENTRVQQHFSLQTTDLEVIRYWITHTGIRWGIDATNREQMALPAFAENTWREGLQRLLLGYALPPRSDRLFKGILPYANIEGDTALILGKFVVFVENLFKCVAILVQPRTLPEWATVLENILHNFFETAQDNQAQIIRHELHQLLMHSQQAQFNEFINIDMLLECLRPPLTQKEQSTNFLTGNVTFCSLLPMRGIPFQIICLVGMNDQTFPRTDQPLGFDLLAQHPQRGDRSRRDSDRYVFLETLLAARKYFYLSYVGRSIRDNTTQPPSVVVSELQDYLSKGFTSDHGDLLEHIVTHHPLQPFSPLYFQTGENSSKLFSYFSEYCTASIAMQGKRQNIQTFFDTALPEAIVDYKTVSIDQLTRFFLNPTEFLLKERLGIRLPEQSQLLAENEPFTVKGLERYQFKQTLVEKSLDGQDLVNYQPIAKATGQLPHGQVGDVVYGQLCAQVQPFVERVRAAMKLPKLPAQTVDLTLGDKRIHGTLGNLWGDGLFHYRCAPLKARDQVRLWLQHLLLNTLQTLPRRSVLLGENLTYEFQPVADSLAILQTLLDLYWQGLHRPLRFFPETSLVFAETCQASEREIAMYRALDRWLGSDYVRGEIQDEYLQLCFGRAGENTPLNEDFEQLASQFFEPLLAHRRLCT